MIEKRYIQIEGGTVISEFKFQSENRQPVPNPALMDVTDRAGGPFIGKLYDAETDTFSDPPPEN